MVQKYINRMAHRRMKRGVKQRRFMRGGIHLSVWLSVAALFLFVSGFVYGWWAVAGGRIAPGRPSTGTTVNTRSPSMISDARTVRVLSLGDSLAHGFGDVTGHGYVGDFSRLLRKEGYQVQQSNLGVDGLTSTGLLKELNQPSTRRSIREATLILVSIGGNDLNNAAGLPNINVKRIEKARAGFTNHLQTILGNLHHTNPRATIALIGLYNPYGSIASLRATTSPIVSRWVAEEQNIVEASQNTMLVPLFDLFELHSSAWLYEDHFHPNQTGYQQIANRLWEDLQGSL